MALQWRRLLPLLANRSHTARPPRCLPYLEHIFAGISGYPSSHLWPVLFPSLRSCLLSLVNNPFKLLCQAFDELLPLSVSERLNAKTFLAMPVHLSPTTPGLRKLFISDIIVHDPQTANLRLRTANEYPRFQRLCRKTIALLLQG
ncbi:hypothetical protein CU097_003897 [Rhizopus azygosporus]|uniref:Uncharacterized protein n=1 Tax=Rhizopus azygosporus TaxID=86630 RepID=A0A367J779_RHIAZ|nr:hypothetical protein CU097_003897 [Rhizopus azygosporus]